MHFDRCEHVHILPHQASIEDQFPSDGDILTKGETFQLGAILQDQVCRLGLGVKR